ncbi:MAG TPA: MFS transporter [Quisquiliibacterium sp.]|nr:MFS transporter [Quisquiliibacterium sp.]HQD83747.1 MFS transporter [Quisquiliibacterium sp.]
MRFLSPDTFRSLRHRPFRLFVLGQTVSIVGFWTQQIALGWTVYRLTGSTEMLGLVAFASNIPMLVVAPFAGVFVDRFDRRTVVLVTQSTQMAQAVLLAVLSLTGTLRVEHIVALSLVYGLTWAFDAPARQSLLPVMTGGREDLPNAIALNSAIMNLGRFIGPAVAGLLLGVLGEGGCFAVNALSYLAVLPALWVLPPSRAASTPTGVLHELREGFSWVWHCVPARMLIASLLMASFALPTYQSMMPAFARDVFGGGAQLQGLLISCAGAGALVGTTMLAARGSIRGLARIVTLVAPIGGAALLLFAASPRVWIAMPALAVIGFSMVVVGAGINTVLQSIVEDRLRARVVSIYMMCFLGVMPLGSLSLGVLAQRFGVQWSLAGYGLVCLLVTGALAMRYPVLRAELGALYRRLGIPP